jgi:hypothetical protein
MGGKLFSQLLIIGQRDGWSLNAGRIKKHENKRMEVSSASSTRRRTDDPLGAKKMV